MALEEKIIFFVVKVWKLVKNDHPRGWAIVDPQGHDWLDLCKAPHNILLKRYK